MKAIHLFTLFIFACLFACSKDDEEARTATQKVDGYTEGASVAFNTGFIVGEEAAVTLTAPDYPGKVTLVSFFFGGTGSNPVTRDVILTIYRDNGGDNPGEILYSDTYSIISSDDDLQKIDVSEHDLVLDGGSRIRVSLRMTEQDYPSVARDDDGNISADHNWVKDFNGTWIRSSVLGVTGDWIIRATVEEV
jgi:hypothetical protein